MATMLLEPRTTSAPAVRLDVPPDFHLIPLDPGVESRTAAQLEVVAALGLSTPGQREAVSLYLEALSGRLSSGNIVGTAFCAVSLAGHPSSATLTVALHETRTADATLAVLGAAEAMRRDGHYDRVEILAAGGRPVASATAQRSLRPGDTVTDELGSTLQELSVLVPLAGQPYPAMLTLSTPSLADAVTYQALLLDICATVRPESSALRRPDTR